MRQSVKGYSDNFDGSNSSDADIVVNIVVDFLILKSTVPPRARRYYFVYDNSGAGDGISTQIYR